MPFDTMTPLTYDASTVPLAAAELLRWAEHTLEIVSTPERARRSATRSSVRSPRRAATASAERR